MEIDTLASVYKEIAQISDIDIAMKIHEHFKGQQIMFLQRLYDKDFIYSFVKENYKEYSVRELSKMFNYSDRRIRQILNKTKYESMKEEK